MGGDDLYPGMARNQPGPGPFGFKFWDGYYTLMIDSDIYMRALVNDFMSAGGQMVERVFEDREDLAALDQKTIVNCMGLGAGKVFDDPDITAMRGQLSFLLPQNNIDYGYVVPSKDYGLLYSFPRKTGILLGGSGDLDDYDLSPRADEVDRMVKGHAWLSSRLG